jgi:hypothetical protein
MIKRFFIPSPRYGLLKVSAEFVLAKYAGAERERGSLQVETLSGLPVRYRELDSYERNEVREWSESKVEEIEFLEDVLRGQLWGSA